MERVKLRRRGSCLGEITLRDQGGRTEVRASMEDPGDGLYRAALRGELSSIADLLEPVEQRTLALSQTITSSKALLGDMTDTTVSLRTQLNDLEKALLGLESGAGDVRQVIRGLADMKSSLRSLQRALGDSHVGGSSSGDRNTPKLQEQVDKVKAVGSIYSIEDEGQFLNQMLALQGKSQEEIAGINQLLSIPAGQVPEGMEQAWQAAQTAKAGMEALHKQSFQTFCDTLLKQQNPSMSDSERAAQAKQMSDLWTVYNSGPAKPSSGTGSTVEQPPAATESSAPEEGAPEGEGEDEPQSPAEEQPDEQPEEAGESDLPEQEEPEEAGESGLPEQKEPEAETETPLGGLVAASLLRPGMGLMSGALISGSIDLDGAELPSAGSAPVSDAASAPEQIADTSPDSGGDQFRNPGGCGPVHLPVAPLGQVIKPGPAVPKGTHSTISQSGSTFLHTLTTCFMIPSNWSPSASMVIF